MAAKSRASEAANLLASALEKDTRREQSNLEQSAAIGHDNVPYRK